jgi:predicted MPP superfamily phosphohydrolase/energy-coupling factor transporter ATP-binding protein EcfA2
VSSFAESPGLGKLLFSRANINMDECTILHISDLHFSIKDTFGQNTALGALLARVKQDRKKGLEPEIVVVTGDIAKTGQEAEYVQTKSFFAGLLKVLELPRERLFVVPGNHDVNRKAYRPKDIPAYENMTELNQELEDPAYRADLLKGMDAYFGYVESESTHLKPIGNRLVPFVTRYTARCGKTLGMVGLNSAWMCRKSPDEREIAIGEYQLGKALEKAEKAGKADLTLYLFHHPLNWLWEADRRICRSKMDQSIILCGHLHDAAGGLVHDLDANLLQFQAGGAYLGVESEHPNRFQYLTIDWEANCIRLNFRKFDKTRRHWVLDGETGQDGMAELPLWDSSSKASQKETTKLQEEWPVAYCQWIIENCGHMDTERLQGRGQAIVVRLPEIYIPLYTMDPKKEARSKTQAATPDSRQTPVELETLIAQNPSTLVEGHPGSGKTTLLKHLAFCLASKKPKECHFEPNCELLPVLILLKELERIFDDPEFSRQDYFSADEYLTWYFKRKVSGIVDFHTLENFLKKKQTLIMLDGLDEVRLERRNKVVDAFADLMIKYPGNKIVLTGRPHGISEVPLKRFGRNLARILSLTMDQARDFIHKWFSFLFQASSSLSLKNAEAMIAEIKSHPAMEGLIDNPLMLTAVCILYYDGKELPGQRAELYKKFIDNMLYRRFDDPEVVHDFLKSLAHYMHTKNLSLVDRETAIEHFGKVDQIQDDETQQRFRKRIQTLFDEIEPRCGLLKYENGQYGFWHLTFQEFLAAHYLADNFSDLIQAIEPYWGKHWWEEAIELYIGLLSMEHKKVANDIVAKALNTDDAVPFGRWRLACRSLLDIHEKRREAGVESLARQRLIEIIDTGSEPRALADTGETLGWLGDPRELKNFVAIEGGDYDLEKLDTHTIESFEIGRYPVTNAWFAEFLDAGGYEAESLWSSEGQKWLRNNEPKQPEFWDERRWKCPNAPVVGVCWYEADAFCRWLTGDRKDGHTYFLPSEIQWQAAAAGRDKREYPWGEKITPGHCNYDDTEIGNTTAVGIFKIGDTPDGVADLAGNVWEWTDSWYDDDEDAKVLGGGSWVNSARDCRCAARSYFYLPDDRDFYFGFRCARI